MPQNQKKCTSSSLKLGQQTQHLHVQKGKHRVLQCNHLRLRLKQQKYHEKATLKAQTERTTEALVIHCSGHGIPAPEQHCFCKNILNPDSSSPVDKSYMLESL